MLQPFIEVETSCYISLKLLGINIQLLKRLETLYSLAFSFDYQIE